DASSVRAELGTALRRFVERMHEEHAEPFIVLVGDYNDDPFSPSLANHLLATRDRSLARRDSRFLYNPFWRKIGQSHDSDFPNEAGGFCGTHFYAGGENSQWFTYDQIIFSAAFLQEKSLSLNENLCGIVAPASLRAKLVSRREIFDHLPVLGTVELRSES
ncbi:endonuclease/exonuclease/phosphatase family protein, partial [Burkholderia sola]